jgi:aminopeptidase N
MSSKSVKRLFESFQPQHYKINLHPNREAMTFHGSVIIAGQKSGRPSQRLVLHQKGLKFTSAKLIRHDKKGDHEFVIDRINRQESFNEVRIHTKDMQYPGKYTITLEFEGIITRQMDGIYPCYFKHDGIDKKLIATQFESHHAREVFPCVDEPEAKATFELTLDAPEGETVLSNTPVVKQDNKDGITTTTFQRTPHMSTYLLAFIYGDLGYLEAKTKDHVLVRTYATPDNVEHTKFALDVAVKCLEFFNDYFGIDYPLPKCDLIALPDFASGAMENWGCITFREHAMLVDPANTSLSSKQYVAMVVAHELAHQWFGNLVTMRWWTDLWLNEGFASWIEYLAVDHIYPEWKMWTQFVIDEQQQALKLDALEHTHPIEVVVTHPDEIRTIFDAISYSKGASSIHMLHSYLGPEAFQTGLRYYLKKHSYSNTDTSDLWDALEEASEKPVKGFMDAWTSQPGFPLVRATVEEGEVSLVQERFYSNPAHKVVTATTWPIATQAHSAGLPALFEVNKAIYPAKETTEFKLNRSHSGFYRTTYNSTHLQRLGEQVKKGHLGAVDRLGILTDLAECAKAGYADSADLLHFLENFHAEDNYAVWDTISSIIGSMRMVMDDDGLRDLMKPFIRKLVAPQLKRLGWDRIGGESHFDRLLRPIILGMAASADEPAIVKHCQELFASIEKQAEVASHQRVNPSHGKVKRGIDIDPDLRGMVFGTVARLGGAVEFEKLLKLHNEASLSEERITLSAALTGFTQPDIIARALDTIDTDQVRLQDVTYWIAYSFLNRHAKQLTWEWLKSHWDWLDKSLGTDLSFYRMPVYSGRAFSDVSFLDEYKAFFKTKMSVTLERSYNQGLEIIEWQSAWKKRSLKEIKTFFEAQ